MDGGDSFSRYHPAVSFLYFVLVLGFTMFLMHPAALAISLFSGVCYRRYLSGRGALRAQLGYLLPVMGMAALINPLFNHAGDTILVHFPWGSPLTLESMFYGLAAAVLLAAVVMWFSCYTAVMTSDKFVYLFGRAIPALSLVLSMTLRFVPKFQVQLRAVTQAQRGVGRSVSDGPMGQRVRSAIAILSIMLTWSMENAIETADSMKSRGYGLPGRTSFSLYPWEERDRLCLAWLGAMGFFLLCGWGAGALSWRYYPTVSAAPVSPLSASLWLGYLCLCMTPMILNGREDLAWRRMNSTA